MVITNNLVNSSIPPIDDYLSDMCVCMSVCESICIHMYVYMCVCMFMCMCLYVCVSVHVCICKCMCACVFLYVCLSICVSSVCAFVCVPVCVWNFKHVWLLTLFLMLTCRFSVVHFLAGEVRVWEMGAVLAKRIKHSICSAATYKRGSFALVLIAALFVLFPLGSWKLLPPSTLCFLVTNLFFCVNSCL